MGHPEDVVVARRRRLAQLPIRAGFVLRSFTYGGAEHDVIQLTTESDARIFDCIGMAVQMPYPVCPDLPLDHPRVPHIFQPGAVTEHPKVINSDSFASAVAAVAASADVLISWGVPDLAEVLPLEFSGRIVVTSKASGDYQESFLHANALMTSDYVANSVKSIEGFPPPVRHRAKVIYPGIDDRRLAGTGDREAQRAIWKLGPQDRVVGYLGRLAPDKGVEQLVEAVSRMPPEWTAVFVGRNGNFPDYERRLSRLCRRKLPGRYRIVDWTTAIGEVLPAFDVLAYPTRDEGFSNTLAEAWLLGVPTVATEGVGALAERHWAGCAVTIPRDYTADELAHAIREAFGNDPLTTRARRRARKLTVKATLEDWQQYLTGIARRTRHTRVMVLLPNALIGGIPSWLLTLMRHTPRIDWCCLCVLSETDDYAADGEVLDELVSGGCPVMGIPHLSADETRRRLMSAIRQTRPDIVLQAGVKRVDERYPETDIPLVTVSHGPVDCDWARDVLSDSSRRATQRVAISATARRAFPTSLRREVPIIANGVEVPTLKDLRPAARRRARKELGVSAEEIAVGFVGRLSPEKNPLAVAHAVETLPEEYQSVFIGPDCADVVTEIRRISARFRHVGPVPPNGISSLLPGLDVLVCPSEYESFGLAIVEAWSAMVPVVSTRVGVVAEFPRSAEVAVVVPPDPSPRTLSRAIRRAIAEREQRIHTCRDLARKHYNARRMGREWQKFLQDVAAGATVPEHASVRLAASGVSTAVPAPGNQRRSRSIHK